MRTSNPTLNPQVFADSRTAAFPGSERMTLDGTIHRTGILLVLAVLGAAWPWHLFWQSAAAGSEGLPNPAVVMPWLIGGVIGGLVFALVTVFKQSWAPLTAPAYAILEGLFLGSVSAVYQARYGGIVVQAVALTLGTLLCMLALYKTGVIRATEKFKLGVVAATGAIFVVYMASWVLALFHVSMPFLNDSSPIGIGISLVVVTIAALNLVLDFDFIERGAAGGAPRYMEWYGAFGLMVTLVWLYVEFLRLLAKLNNRR